MHAQGVVAACAGFTLIEIMVVLAIVGLMSGIVLLTLPDQSATLHRQADGFANHLVRAREEAIIGAAQLRVRADVEGYQFERRHRGRWQPLPGRAFEPRQWRDGVAPRFEERQTQASFLFDATGASEPQWLVLSSGERHVAVLLDGAGEVGIDVRAR